MRVQHAACTYLCISYNTGIIALHDTFDNYPEFPHVRNEVACQRSIENNSNYTRRTRIAHIYMSFAVRIYRRILLILPGCLILLLQSFCGNYSSWLSYFHNVPLHLPCRYCTSVCSIYVTTFTWKGETVDPNEH